MSIPERERENDERKKSTCFQSLYQVYVNHLEIWWIRISMQFLGKGGSNARLQRAIEWTAKYPKFFITYFGPTRVTCTLNHPDTVKILLKGAGKRFHLNMGTGFGIITNIVRAIFHTAFQYSLYILEYLRTILTRRILYTPSRLSENL